MFGNKINKNVTKKIMILMGFFFKIFNIFLSIIIKNNNPIKKYTAAYLARNANPKNRPNKKKFKVECFFLISKTVTIANDQNNNNNKSVETKNEDKLVAGIIKKLPAHKTELFLEKDNFRQIL